MATQKVQQLNIYTSVNMLVRKRLVLGEISVSGVSVTKPQCVTGLSTLKKQLKHD